jgi:beta-glucosidase
VFYSQLRHRHGQDYADLTQEPAFSFGFGLSYTRYDYSNLRVLTPKLALGAPVIVEVDVKNAGERDGTEVVQAYVSDVVASVTWPSKLLVGFQRIELKAGETKRVRFEIPFERLSLVDAYERRVVEPGEFEIAVGASSRVEHLLVDRFEVQGRLTPLDRIPGVAVAS